MKFSLKLLESNEYIRKEILKAIMGHLQKSLSSAVSSIKSQIGNTVIEAIKNQPEYESLLSGKLKFELGIPNASAAVDAILSMWISNMEVSANSLSLSNSGIKGGFSINMIKTDYSDVLSSSYAVVYDNTTGNSLPWLQWLLLDGSKILVKKHDVKIGPSPYSRTGMAVMIESSSNWRVPPEFAGTINNNWITRALSNIDSKINNIIQQEIESAI